MIRDRALLWIAAALAGAYALTAILYFQSRGWVGWYLASPGLGILAAALLLDRPHGTSLRVGLALAAILAVGPLLIARYFAGLWYPLDKFVLALVLFAVALIAHAAANATWSRLGLAFASIVASTVLLYSEGGILTRSPRAVDLFVLILPVAFLSLGLAMLRRRERSHGGDRSDPSAIGPIEERSS